MDEPQGERREPLAGLHTYEPVPTKKLFPLWEAISKFGWIVALAVAGFVGYRFWKPEDRNNVVPVQHFAPASKWTSDKALNLAPAISHDGKLVAYASDREGNGGLAIWTRLIDSGEPVRLTSGEFNETDPDFSPDDRLIAYRSERNGGGIYVKPIDGSGPPKLIARNGRKPKFSPDGKWISFFRQSESGDAAGSLSQVFIVPPEGGEPRCIQPSFVNAQYPIWAPDGRHLLFAGLRRDGAKDWWLSPLDGGETAPTHALEWLNKSLKIVVYPNHWKGESIFFSGAEEFDTHVWELPISTSTMQVTGPPRRLSDGKNQEQQAAIGSSGRILFSSLEMTSEIWSLPMDANGARVAGKLERLTDDGVRAHLPAVAANGSRMVYVSDKSGVRDVWVSDADGKAGQAITSFRQVGYRPLLSPDGGLLVYPSTVNRKCTVLLQEVARPTRIIMLKGCFDILDWSPDASSVLTVQSGQRNKLHLTKIIGGEQQTALSHPGGNISAARFSPDGRWIAFAAGATRSTTRVFIAPWWGSAAPEREWIVVNPEGGGDPAWSPDGNVLYFHSKRDANLCIWAQKLGVGKAPAGEPIAILHLHSAALGMAFLKPSEFGIAVSKDRLTLNLGRTSGTLWTMTLPRIASPRRQ